ncbi:MAG: hypothetical protein R3E32_25020 [Chitinophagales bacterium]
MKHIGILFFLIYSFARINAQESKWLQLDLNLEGKNKYRPSLGQSFGYYDPIGIQLSVTNISVDNLDIQKLLESNYLTFEIRDAESNEWEKIFNYDYSLIMRNRSKPEKNLNRPSVFYSNEVPIQIYDYSKPEDKLAIDWFKKERTLLPNSTYDPQSRSFKKIDFEEIANDENYFKNLNEDLFKKKEKFIQEVPNSYYSDYFKWEVAKYYISLFSEATEDIKDDVDSEIYQYLVKAKKIAEDLLENTNEDIYREKAKSLLGEVVYFKELHNNPLYQKNKKSDDGHKD